MLPTTSQDSLVGDRSPGSIPSKPVDAIPEASDMESLPDPSDLSLNDEDLRKALTLAITIGKQQSSQIKKLQHEVEQERGQVRILKHDVQALRKQTVALQLSAETEEEYISNTLLKRIADMKQEKTDLLLEVEREEEYLTNTLQRKLNQLQKEKIDLENALEQEQERMINQLQRQFDTARLQTPSSAAISISSSPASSSGILGIPVSSPSPHRRPPSYSFGGGESSASSVSMTEFLKADINSLRLKVTDLEKELVSTFNQSQVYKRELVQLRQQLGLSVSGLLEDDVGPNVMRLVFPDRPVRARRSMSTSQSDPRGVMGPFSYQSTDNFRYGRILPDPANRRTSDIGVFRAQSSAEGAFGPLDGAYSRSTVASAPNSNHRPSRR
ncbi:hypothetical protein H4R34_004037 [Dimargaris verticillata]|uniref:Coiled-coil domain-containing protein 6 n=1 Tax=Dimargaris verticillata TaxID=2761393 RepID=A0A9W8B190_9FUNG|nr:hypothetical protein H4R34_004037 [Dimargaris verticillata]